MLSIFKQAVDCILKFNNGSLNSIKSKADMYNFQVAAEEKLPCKIGFFLHIPFPQWDIFKIFPWEDQILQVLKFSAQ